MQIWAQVLETPCGEGTGAWPGNLRLSVPGRMSGDRGVTVKSCSPGWQGGFKEDRATDAGTECK